MHEDIEKILIGEDEIKARVAEAGAKISRDFAGKDPIFVGVLKGCFIFMADLMRWPSRPTAAQAPPALSK